MTTLIIFLGILQALLWAYAGARNVRAAYFSHVIDRGNHEKH